MTWSGCPVPVRRFVASLLVLALAGCSSLLPGGSGGSRGGGYYLDDGPGGSPPVDPMSVPDPVPRAEPLKTANMKPYVALGRRYEPMTGLAPYRAQGVASWYGRRYHGRKTASGEVYDMYSMTGAHPTLPIPSYVRVTHLANRRSVIVRINDRGPFLNERLIDLSYTAAARLGYLNAGSAKVEVELITRFDDAGIADAPVAPTATATATTTATATATTTATATVPTVGGAAAAGAGTGEPGLASGPLVLRTEAVGGDGASPSAAMRGDSPSPIGTGAQSDSSARLEAVHKEPTRSESTRIDPSHTAGAPALYLQLGAYTSRGAAESARQRLARELRGQAGDIEVRAENGLYKLHAGPYQDRLAARSAATRIEQSTRVRPFAVSR